MRAGGQWETAREIFDGMISHSCKPDAITYATLIAALDRGGQWGHALQVRLVSRFRVSVPLMYGPGKEAAVTTDAYCRPNSSVEPYEALTMTGQKLRIPWDHDYLHGGLDVFFCWVGSRDCVCVEGGGGGG